MDGYSSQNNKRLQLILDLDNTLICSLKYENELNYVPKKYQRKLKYVNMHKYYRIFKRPYLDLFLDYIFDNFDVSVFTAADKEYALYVIEKILLKDDRKKRRIKYIFYGFHCDLSKKYYDSPKDLRLLWDIFGLSDIKPYNTVILDDLDLVYKANRDNTIVAKKFELLTEDNKFNVDMLNDNFLLTVIPILEMKNRQLQNYYYLKD